MDDLIEFINYFDVAPVSVDVLKTAIWTLTNVFIFKSDLLTADHYKRSLEIFLKYFQHSDDVIQYDCILSISSISNEHDCINELIGSSLVQEMPKLFKDAMVNDTKMLLNLIRITGNIAYGNNSQSQGLFDNGFIPILGELLNQKHERQIIKEVCWIVSNLTVGPSIHIQAVFDADIYTHILKYIKNENFKIRRECLFVISNTTLNANFEQLKRLVCFDVLRDLTNLLDEENHEMLVTTCDTIYNLLDKGEINFDGNNLFLILVDKYGGNN